MSRLPTGRRTARDADATLHSALPHTDDLAAAPVWFGRANRIWMRALLQRRYDLHVTGIDNVPARGQVLLAQNHLNALDGPLVAAVAPRMVHAMTKSEAFTGPVGVGMKLFGQIPVDRTIADIRSIRRCIRELRAGRVVSIYPEGRRGAGDFAVVRGGLAYLALVTGAPIVPLALLGTRVPGGDLSHYPPAGSPIDVVFGEPIRVEPEPYPRTKHRVAELTEELRLRLRGHVEAAVASTGHPLPGVPDQVDPDG